MGLAESRFGASASNADNDRTFRAFDDAVHEPPLVACVAGMANSVHRQEVLKLGVREREKKSWHARKVSWLNLRRKRMHEYIASFPSQNYRCLGLKGLKSSFAFYAPLKRLHHSNHRGEMYKTDTAVLYGNCYSQKHSGKEGER